MKSLLICFFVFLSFVSCNRQDFNRSGIQQFIETLKEDKSQTLQMDDFRSEEISELLMYRTDKTNIINFPRNPLSSFYLEEVQMGMYVLWIVESIRMKEIEDPGYYLFASLNPRIVNTSSGEIVDQNAILSEVAEAYSEWWNSNLPVEEKLKIDPLEDTNLDWN